MGTVENTNRPGVFLVDGSCTMSVGEVLKEAQLREKRRPANQLSVFLMDRYIFHTYERELSRRPMK